MHCLDGGTCMRGQLLFLCLARLRAGSWQLLQGCLSPLLLATVWVPYQVQVHWEQYLGLAPLFGRGKSSGIGNFGCNRHPSKKSMPGRDRVAGRGLLAPDMIHGSANVFKSASKQLLMSPCCVQSWSKMVTVSRKTPTCPWGGHSTSMALSDNVVFTELLAYKN